MRELTIREVCIRYIEATLENLQVLSEAAANAKAQEEAQTVDGEVLSFEDIKIREAQVWYIVLLQ